MNKKNILITTALAAVLFACSEIPKEAYYTHGHPEDLLDNTSERVSLKIQSPASVEEVTGWLNHDQPTRAELKCMEGDALCGEVQSVLHQFSVPVKYSPTAENTVVLVYERIQARECETRYIDNMINPYNLNHPTFGCTLASNIVQMVSDKHEFTNPAMMDNPDAIKASQAYGFYRQPSSFSPPSASSDFNAIATQQSLQTSGLSGGSR